MELSILNISGQVTSSMEVADSLFAVPMNMALVHQALVMYQLNRRQGTSKTKMRSEVAGGGRKPWRQKGTGRARQGSTRAPHWRHGGVAFGPHPRDHRRDMPKRMRNLALRCVLSEKVRGERLIVADGLSLENPSTKEMLKILGHLGIGKSALIVTAKPETNLVISSRNIPKIWTLPVAQINAGELLKRDALVITPEAIRIAEQLWCEDGKKQNNNTSGEPNK